MSIPSGFSRNTLSGHLVGGEIFNISFWCAEAPSDQAATTDQANTFASDISTAFANSGSPVSLLDSQAGYDALTVYSYLDDTGHAKYVAEAPLTAGVGTGSSDKPNQCALVATLLTGVSGRRNRGRLYLPLTKTGTIGNGQLLSGTLGPIATWWATLFDTLNGHIDPAKVCVLSQVGGTSNPVTSVRVDSRIDIQRRRADSQLPLFSSVANV